MTPKHKSLFFLGHPVYIFRRFQIENMRRTARNMSIWRQDKVYQWKKRLLNITDLYLSIKVIISQHILSIHSDNKYSNMKINSILGKLHWNKIQWKILIFKNIFENSEIFFNDFYIGISLLFFLCPVLCRDILILDNYLTPRNGEQDISEECNEAGNEYLIALGTVSIFSWLTSHQTLRKDSFTFSEWDIQGVVETEMFSQLVSISASATVGLE